MSKAGAIVHINGRTQERVDSALQTIREHVPDANVQGIAADAGLKINFYLLNMTKINSLILKFIKGSPHGVKEITEKLEDLDILVNNVGVYEMKNFQDTTDEEWFRMFEVNVMSGVRLSRYYFPKLKQKNWGRIIFISSESAVNIPPEMIHYSASKIAQIAVARGLAEATVGTNVTVNSILVGPTHSEGMDRIVEQFAESQNITTEQVESVVFQTVKPTSLIKRFLKGEEIANMVLFLSSAASSGVSGTAMRVDGGSIRNCI